MTLFADERNEAIAEQLYIASHFHDNSPNPDADLMKEGAARIRELERKLAAARAALRDIRHMEWGKKQAWIVHGPPDKETGIAAAKEITRMNDRIDRLLAPQERKR